MGRKRERWRSLDAAERWQLAKLAIALPLWDIALRLFGYGRLRTAIERNTPAAGSQTATRPHVEAGEHLAKLAAMAGNSIPLFNTSCLRQALFVYWRLRRGGLAPELLIGILPQAGQLNAHAWVELDGTALGQPGLLHRPFVAPAESAN